MSRNEPADVGQYLAAVDIWLILRRNTHTPFPKASDRNVVSALAALAIQTLFTRRRKIVASLPLVEAFAIGAGLQFEPASLLISDDGKLAKAVFRRRWMHLSGSFSRWRRHSLGT